MGAIFNPPSIPKPMPPAPAPPDRGAAQVQDAEASMRQRAANASGRSSTLLAAKSDTAAPDRGKTLLGQ